VRQYGGAAVRGTHAARQPVRRRAAALIRGARYLGPGMLEHTYEVCLEGDAATAWTDSGAAGAILRLV
jgi:hypothetical protein